MRGGGILTTLGIVFIVLKLCGVLTWSWAWVLLPFYGPIVVFFGVMMLLTLTGGIAWVFKEKEDGQPSR